MKNLKKPTYSQKLIIEKNKLKWNEWLVKQETSDTLVIVSRATSEIREIKKN